MNPIYTVLRDKYRKEWLGKDRLFRLCELAINKHISYIDDIPEDFITEDIFNLIYSKMDEFREYYGRIHFTKNALNSYKWIPRKFLTEKILQDAYEDTKKSSKYTYYNFDRISRGLSIDDTRTGYFYSYEYFELKDKFEKSQEQSNKLFAENPHNIRYIPSEYVTSEMINHLKISENFHLIPYKMYTQELANLAFAKYMRAIYIFPQELVTQDMANKVIASRDKDYIRCLPKKFITRELCDQLKKEGCYDLELYPEDYITEEMCLKFVKKYTKLEFKMIPKKFLTQEFFDKAIRIQAKIIKIAPLYLLSDEICQYIIDKGYFVYLSYLPKKFITSKVISQIEISEKIDRLLWIDFPDLVTTELYEAILNLDASLKYDYINSYDSENDKQCDMYSHALSKIPMGLMLYLYKVKKYEDIYNFYTRRQLDFHNVFHDELLEAVTKRYYQPEKFFRNMQYEYTNDSNEPSRDWWKECDTISKS